jgi:hypothetical protein
MNGRSMKKASPKDRDTMRAEYKRSELGKGVRGKYLTQYRAGTNLVLLAPDVAQVFPTEASVNDALRSLITLAASAARLTSASTGRRGKRGGASR